MKYQAHTPGNPRAKGQVERTHDIVERDFEGRLFMMQITDLDQLNQCAWTWMRDYNTRKIHGRHGKPRYGLWQTIRKEQLRNCPPPEICKQLLREGFQECTVRPNLMISYAIQGERQRYYSVKDIPGILVGDKVRACVNPYRYPNVDVLITNPDGTEIPYECTPEERDEYGFFASGPMIGEDYKSLPDTPADRNRKAILQTTYQADTQREADKKRARREPAFGGSIDPISYLENRTAQVTFMNRPGQALDVPGRCQVEMRPLGPIEAMKRLNLMLGRALTTEENMRIRTRYPDGIAESALEEVMTWLTGNDSDNAGPSMAAVN